MSTTSAQILSGVVPEVQLWRCPARHMVETSSFPKALSDDFHNALLLQHFMELAKRGWCVTLETAVLRKEPGQLPIHLWNQHVHNLVAHVNMLFAAEVAAFQVKCFTRSI